MRLPISDRPSIECRKAHFNEVFQEIAFLDSHRFDLEYFCSLVRIAHYRRFLRVTGSGPLFQSERSYERTRLLPYLSMPNFVSCTLWPDG
jgi:hypothetical protein